MLIYTFLTVMIYINILDYLRHKHILSHPHILSPFFYSFVERFLFSSSDNQFGHFMKWYWFKGNMETSGAWGDEALPHLDTVGLSVLNVSLFTSYSHFIQLSITNYPELWIKVKKLNWRDILWISLFITIRWLLFIQS